MDFQKVHADNNREPVRTANQSSRFERDIHEEQAWQAPHGRIKNKKIKIFSIAEVPPDLLINQQRRERVSRERESRERESRERECGCRERAREKERIFQSFNKHQRTES